MSQLPQPRPRGWRRVAHAVIGAVTSTVLFAALIVVNFLQTLSLIVLPFSRHAFRRFNRGCANFWWGLCVVTSEKLGRIELVLTGDPIPDLESAIVVANHQQMPDILALMMVAWKKKRLGDLKWFVKDILKYVPGVGWGMLFLDCLFVRRNWDSDEANIQRTFSKFLRDKIPIWLIQFSEGTRFTPTKLARSQEYARKAGLPEPKHVLIPRTKGFVAAVEGLREHIQAVYDVTIGYPAGIPTLWQYLQGYVRCIHVRVRRFPVAELPRDGAAIARWLQQRFQEKDRLLGAFGDLDAFPAV